MQWTEGITALCGHAAYLPTPAAAHASRTSTVRPGADLQHSCGGPASVETVRRSAAAPQSTRANQQAHTTRGACWAGGHGRAAPCNNRCALCGQREWRQLAKAWPCVLTRQGSQALLCAYRLEESVRTAASATQPCTQEAQAGCGSTDSLAAWIA